MSRTSEGVLAIGGGVALVAFGIILGPVEDISTGGLGIVDDPIAAAAALGGVGLIVWGFSRLAGKTIGRK